MIGFSLFSRDWKGCGEGKERKRTLLYWFGISSLNQRICYFFGRGYGEEKERKRTLKDDSCKVLNLAFLSGCF